MSKSDIKVSCKNVFKHIDKEDIKKNFTDKWIDIIKVLDQIPQNA